MPSSTASGTPRTPSSATTSSSAQRRLADPQDAGGLLDDDQVHDFFNDHVPDDIVSTRQLDRSWRDARSDDPTQLDLTAAVLRTTDGVAISSSRLPDAWTVSDDLSLPLRYRSSRASRSTASR